MAAIARIHSEDETDRSAVLLGRRRGPPPAGAVASPPDFRLACRWEYCAAERRLVQVWEYRPL